MRGMQYQRAAAKLFGRLYRDSSMSNGGEPRRIAPRSGADVEGAARIMRDQVHNSTMRVGERDALVALEQVRRLLGIVFSTADPNRSHPTSSNLPIVGGS